MDRNTRTIGRVLAASALVVAALFAAGCGSSDSATTDGGGGGGSCTVGNATATNAVQVADFSFTPACISVKAGDTVTWTNTGMASHTVTSDSGSAETFDSGALGDSGTFKFTFKTAGTFGYHCIPHQSQGMTGTVVVQ